MGRRRWRGLLGRLLEGRLINLLLVLFWAFFWAGGVFARRWVFGVGFGFTTVRGWMVAIHGGVGVWEGGI